MTLSAAAKPLGVALVATDEGLNIAGTGCFSGVEGHNLQWFDLRQFDLATPERPWFCLSGTYGAPIHVIGCARPASDFRGRRGFIAALCAFARKDVLSMGFRPATELASRVLEEATQKCVSTDTGQVSLQRAMDVLRPIATDHGEATLEMETRTPAQFKAPAIWRQTMDPGMLMSVIARSPDLQPAFLQGYIVRENDAIQTKWDLAPNFFLNWLDYFFEGSEVERAKLSSRILELQEEMDADRRAIARLGADIEALQSNLADAQSMLTASVAEREALSRECGNLRVELAETNRAAADKVSEFERANMFLNDEVRQARLGRSEIAPVDETAPPAQATHKRKTKQIPGSNPRSASDPFEEDAAGPTFGWRSAGLIGVVVIAAAISLISAVVVIADRFPESSAEPQRQSMPLPPWPPQGSERAQDRVQDGNGEPEVGKDDSAEPLELRESPPDVGGIES